MHDPRRILVVEDEASLRFSMVAYLEDSGHACREAADGEEALALLEAEPFDLVITDLRMPRLDGFALLEALRVVRPKLPVVVVTGTRDALVEDESLQRGAQACLFKPLTDMGQLDTTIADLFRGQS